MMNGSDDFKHIVIHYNSGSMMVEITPFLEEQSVAKIKKLIRLITAEGSDPGVLSIIKDHCTAWLQGYDSEQRINANSHVDSREKVRKCEEELARLKSLRSRCKRRSEQYEHYSGIIEETKSALRSARSPASIALQDFNTNLSRKKKYEGIISYITDFTG